MKSQDKQIIQILQAYQPEFVLKAFELYKISIQKDKDVIKKELINDGWIAQKEKPENPSFYFIDDLYWVLSDEVRNKRIQEVKRNSRKTVSKEKVSMNLELVKLLCPFCNSKMYKQNVCPGCKDGKNGYKIRLICENNINHEVLL